GGERLADLGVAVSDAYQGRGAGTVLLEHLAGIAMRNGITEIGADVLGGNIRMLEMLTHSGFLVRDSGAGRVVHCIVPIEWTENAIAKSDQRAFAAAANSVRPLFSPRSVAVVGASSTGRATSLGSVILGNLRAHGF